MESLRDADFSEGVADYDANQERSAYIEEQKAAGNQIVLPADDELQIDIDSQEAYDRFLVLWQTFSRVISARFSLPPTMACAPSRSGLPCRHITIKLPFDIVEDVERIAWQAALGSDSMRELLSLLRHERGDIHPTLFVEKS